jgi:hypothetical protein
MLPALHLPPLKWQPEKQRTALRRYISPATS